MERLGTYATWICIVSLVILGLASSAGFTQQALGPIRFASEELPPTEPDDLFGDEADKDDSQDLAEQCPPPPRLVQSHLTVDIQPVDRPGQVELGSDRPTDCSWQIVGEAPTVFVEPTCHGFCYGNSMLFSCARFCHRPLYFEETWLERYGVSHGCWQPAISAAHFFGGALMFPCKIRRVPCNTCVRTPPPL